MLRGRRAFILAIAFAVGCAAAREDPQVRRLKHVLQSPDNPGREQTELSRAAIDAGRAAVPLLRELLRDPSERIRSRAATALAYIGGDAAVAALRREHDRAEDSQIKALLCSALASTGSADDRAFLIRALAGEHLGNDWEPIVSSALSLGVLRASEATGALEATAAKEPDSRASHAAAEALRWIRQGSWQVQSGGTSEEDAAVAAVLANGIPRTDEASKFGDPSRDGVWERTGGRWRFRPGEAHHELPTLRFAVHISPDRARSLVSVAVTFGFLDAVGYDYVLQKDRSKWRPTAIFSTWIS